MARIHSGKRSPGDPDLLFARALEQLVRLLARQAAIQHCRPDVSESSSSASPAPPPES